MYSYRDRLADGARDLAEAVRHDPGKPSYQATYGDILRKQGRTAEAAAAYQAALALDNDFAPALGGLEELNVQPAAGGGDLVHRAQATLGRLGYPVGAADGRAGPKTAAAVRAYQRSEGLPQDGSGHRVVGRGARGRRALSRASGRPSIAARPTPISAIPPSCRAPTLLAEHESAQEKAR